MNPCVTWENGEKVLYMELLKALYGTVKATHLFWEQLVKHLIDDWGLTLNPYDQCVANKVVNGKQCTIVWYINDLKLFHVEEEVGSDMMERLNKEFGGREPMTVSEGKIHDYLRITLDYSTEGTLKVVILMGHKKRCPRT